MSLPRPLLELAWLRLNSVALLEKQHVPRAFAHNSRFALAHRLVRRMHMQMHAPDASPMPDYGIYSAPGDMDLTDASFLRRRERPMRLMKPSAEHVELKSRLDELLKLPVLTPEEATREDEQIYEPQITEEQLRAIYVDLLAPIKDDAVSEEEKVKLLPEPEELLEIIESLEERLAILMEDTTRGEQNLDEGLAAKLLVLQSRPQPALDAPAETAKADSDVPRNAEELTVEAARSETETPLSAHVVAGSDVHVREEDSEVAALEDAVGTEEPDRLPSLQSASPVPNILVPTVSDLDMNRPVHRVLARLDILLDRWRQDGVIVSVKDSETAASPTPGGSPASEDAEEITIMPIGLSIITLSDWTNILHSAIQASDVVAGDVALRLMERARVPVDADLRALVLKIHADIGNIACVESFIARHCPEPNLEEIHLRIKAYARGGKQSESCTILHQYEARGLILPIKTYHSVIMCLMYGKGAGESQRRAQAWDMFAHMRYVAHTVPDRRMYNHMIKACSMGFVESDAERAMDIWTEMTMDHKIEPDIDSYNAIIRVCARNKNYLMESFRFARAMMDTSRDAHGVPAMYPNYHTFIALLQASKRMGALSRARWLFAEILRVASHGALVINDNIMQQVFHTYATYRPPYIRRQVKLMTAGDNGTQDVPFSPSTDIAEDNDAASSDQVAGPPGISQVLAEADALFERVVFEQNAGSGLLSQIEKTAQLGNAYLAVYSNHADFERVKEAYKRIFTESGYPTDHTTLLALSFKARAISKRQPQAALQFAWELFDEWQRRYGDKAAEMIKPKGDVLDARTTGWAAWRTMPRAVDVERFWGNMIDILAFAGQLDDAMTLVRKFEYIYPPQNMREPLPTSPLRDMRTSLYADRPVVRFSSTTEVADDTVPPMLLFVRLEVLHQRLLLKERVKDIRHITWLSNAYSGSLEMRRDAAWGRQREPKERKPGVAAAGNGFWPKPIMPPPSRQASAPHLSSERRRVAGGRG